MDRDGRDKGEIMPDILKYLQKPPQKYWFDACKLIYHPDRVQAFLKGEKIAPIHIDMGIHKSCNIRCIYCYGIKQKMSTDYIPRDRLLMLAEDASKAGVKSIAVIGDGEPILNKGLYDFVDAGVDSGIDMSVATNGLLLTDDMIERLCKKLTWLRFNISGVGEEYDKIHGTRHGFKKFEGVITKAVEMGKRYGCTIGLQMVLIPQCFNSVIPLSVYAKRWGVDYLVIKQYSDGGKDMPMHFDIHEYHAVERVLQTVEEMSTDDTNIIVKWSAMKDSEDITMESRWGFDRCIDLPFIFQISGNGVCYPCGYFFGNSEYCYGDITKERLADILQSKTYWDIIQRIKDTPLQKLCQGQCRHCETDKFMDRLVKVYDGDLTKALAVLFGGIDGYKRIVDNPPEHINFI